ncbi:recombinase family protein [Pseudomonas sp. CNPSo 3701]|uniref:recombinase family protein n=1 Tax=Pseudomonas sp. CNPSo 3701 TaxID=3027943 RepID=UPI002364886E|nr:recombinase family protein [Pseudomonas sp. CNPSo 3701]MDD1509097.1 recombinase family protein [Pseudomonas sp. CNPSo 3701]
MQNTATIGAVQAAGRFIGYARASLEEREAQAQVLALHAEGCAVFYVEQGQNAWRNRPELARLLGAIQPGDTLMVTRLDRLARSTRDLLEIAEHIHATGAQLASLAEPWVSGNAAVLAVFAGIVAFERSLIVERTSLGREAAKARGVQFGAKPCLAEEQICLANQMIEQGSSVSEAASKLGVHRSTLYRALGRVKQPAC